MKISDLLFELRRNPEINNSRITGPAAAVQFLKGKDASKYGVSMTNIPKLGINPKSQYNTPVGIYFYPAEYYLSLKRHNQELPFANYAAYIQIFKLEGPAPDISKLTQTEYRQYIKHIYENIKDISRLLNKSEESTSKLLSTVIDNADTNAKVSGYGGQLWYIFYAILKDVYPENSLNSHYSENVIAKHEVVLWNKLLRLAGFKIIIDTGAGIIHENEPYQGIVLDPRYISHEETIKNNDTGSTASNEKKKSIEKIFSKIVDSDAPINFNILSLVLELIESNNLKFNNDYAEIYAKIMNKIMKFLRGNPTAYAQLGDDYELLLSITNNSDFKRELIIGWATSLYRRNFNRVVEWFNEFEALMNSDQWKLMSKEDKEKKFMHRPNDFTLTRIAKTLTPFVSRDKNAQEIVFAINNAMAKVNQIKQMIAKT